MAVIDSAAAEALQLKLADSPALPENDTTRALLQLRDDCKGEQVALTVVVTDATAPSLGMVRFCNNNGIDCLVLPIGEAHRIPGDGHFPVTGNRIVAQCVAKRVAQLAARDVQIHR